MPSIRRKLRSRILSSPLGPFARQLKTRIKREDHRVLFFFSGASGEWPTMGQQLYATKPVFRQSIERCSSVVEKHLGFEINSEFASKSATGTGRSQLLGRERVGERGYAVVTLAALQIAQCDLWRSQGIMPDGVVSMSMGECPAAYAAGALTLEDSMQVTCLGTDAALRTAFGKIFFLPCGHHAALKLRQGAPVNADIFGEFSPSCTLMWVAGDDYREMKRFLKQEGVSCPAVTTDVLSHTSHMSFAREKMKREMSAIKSRPFSVPFYSALTASRVPRDMSLDWLFWYGLVSQQCRLGEALQSALRDGYNTLLNIGARPTAQQWIEQNALAVGRSVRSLDSMRHDEPERTTWDQTSKELRARTAGKTRKATKSVPSKAAQLEAARTKILTLEAQFLRDPYPSYELLRSEAPIHYFPSQDFWLVLGHGAVAEILLKADKFSNSPVRGYDTILAGSDPPGHTRVRRLVSRYFSASKMQGCAEYANQTATELLKGVEDKAQFDVLEEFSPHMSEIVMGHFLGMSDEAVSALREQSRPFRHDAVELLGKLVPFFYGYAETMKASPSADFCSQLIAGQGEEELSLKEISELMSIIWIAGTHTTNTLIPELMLLLVANPDIRAEVQANNDLIPAFVEEALRLSSPVHNTIRIARESTSIAGITIPEDARVKVCIGAANRDPAHFTNPHSILLDRNARNAIMFGNGIHRCVGATLARVEARAVVEALFQEMPNFRAAEPLSALHWNKSVDIRGLESFCIAPQ